MAGEDLELSSAVLIGEMVSQAPPVAGTTSAIALPRHVQVSDFD